MDKEQKVQVVFEFDRSEYDALLFLMNTRKDKETEAIWEEMTKEPVIARTENFGDQEQAMKLAVISMAIVSVKDKVRNNGMKS